MGHGQGGDKGKGSKGPEQFQDKGHEQGKGKDKKGKDKGHEQAKGKSQARPRARGYPLAQGRAEVKQPRATRRAEARLRARGYPLAQGRAEAKKPRATRRAKNPSAKARRQRPQSKSNITQNKKDRNGP